MKKARPSQTVFVEFSETLPSHVTNLRTKAIERAESLGVVLYEFRIVKKRTGRPAKITPKQLQLPFGGES